MLCLERQLIYLNIQPQTVFSHVLEHIPDYQQALGNLRKLIKEDGIVLLQVPFLEASHVHVTWEEFHGDRTKVFHRFGFDLDHDLENFFSKVEIIVSEMDFELTSAEISKEKY